MPRVMYTRREWGAKEPKHIVPVDKPVERAVFSYGTNSLPCRGFDECKIVVKKLQLKHFRMGMSDIAYNFLVSTDGNYYEGRGWGVEPSQRLKYQPGNRVDIAFIGRYSLLSLPTDMHEAAMELLSIGCEKKFINDYPQIKVATEGEKTPDRMVTAGFNLLVAGLYEGRVVREYILEEIINTYRKKGKPKLSDIIYQQTHNIKVPGKKTMKSAVS